MEHKDFLFQILDLLEANNIEYWLMCGTLLGAMRDGTFLPGDHCDTDIAVKIEDYWKVRRLLDQGHAKHEFNYDYLRRLELTVKDTEYKYKVDIFFMEKEEDRYYIYSYRPNPETKVWNYEWRAWFPYDLFFPVQYTTFLGRKVAIPNQWEQILEIHYGKSWKVPDPTWVSNEPVNKDSEYVGFYPAGIAAKDIVITDTPVDFAYIMVNVLRPTSTKECIKTLKTHYPNIKIYIADQDSPTGDMLQFYEQYGVEYYFVPFDCGLSWARNFLIEKVTESYIMWGDNDFVFCEDSKIEESIELLKSNEDIGVVGGSVYKNGNQQHYERFLIYDKENGILVYVPLDLVNPEPHYFKENPYYYCDLTFNYAIAKKDIFANKQIRWNEAVKVKYEHTDAFLKMKLFSPYKVVYFPLMKVHHIHDSPLEYRKLRHRKTDDVAFSQYWGLKMNFTIGQGQEVYGQDTKPIKQYEKQVLIAPELNAAEKLMIELASLLDENNIHYTLLEHTCQEYVMKFQLSPELTIGCEPTTALKDLLLSANYKQLTETVYSKQGITLIIKNDIHNHWKFGTPLNEKTLKIPCPVVHYLKSLYGEKWNK